MRPSPRDRERTIGALRGAYVAGLLSLETLEQRAERAFTAREGSELAVLTHDLPGGSLPQRLWRWLNSAVSDRSAPGLLIEIAVPPDSETRQTWSIGRSARSNLRINHDTVSRRHAVLERRGDAWLLRDCGSTNGTLVNGWRVDAEALVHPGDEITLGDVSIVLV